MLALSQAVVEEAKRFEALGFAHNDIKPENFLYKQKVDGSFQVRYIDWATGGFAQEYTGNEVELKAIFAEIFGKDLFLQSEADNCFDAHGRFVKYEQGKVIYGVNPRLEILHGARNGTLPYLSPNRVLGAKRQLKSVGDITDPDLNTNLTTNDPVMDNWALTAMTFGICNRQAYFALVKGRAVMIILSQVFWRLMDKSP